MHVDGVEVAWDASDLASLEFSNGGLYISMSNTLEADTFFSGLIDDVRIYNGALSTDEIAALAQ